MSNTFKNHNQKKSSYLFLWIYSYSHFNYSSTDTNNWKIALKHFGYYGRPKSTVYDIIWFSKNSSKHCCQNKIRHTRAQIWCSLKTCQNTRAQISGVLCRLLAATLTAIFRAPYAAATTGRANTPASVRWIALWADSKKDTNNLTI